MRRESCSSMASIMRALWPKFGMNQEPQGVDVMGIFRKVLKPRLASLLDGG